MFHDKDWQMINTSDIYQSARSRDVSNITQILQEKHYVKNDVERAFDYAINNGDIEWIQAVIDNPNFDYDISNSMFLIKAAEKDNAAIVVYLLKNKNQTPNINLKNESVKVGSGLYFQNEYPTTALCAAVQNNNLPLVKWLLTSKDLKKNATLYNVAEYMCADDDNLEMTHYLLSSPDLKKHIDMKKYGATLFMNAHQHGADETMKELVHTYKLTYTPIIKKFLEQHEDESGWLRFFESRQLQEQMDGDLPVNDVKIKRAKI